MKVAIFGSGNVGRALGKGLAGRGDEVMLGTREPSGDRATAWIKAVGKNARTGSLADAAAFGELAVLATNWSGTENAIRLAGPDRLAGKVLIDVTNPLEFRENAPPRLALGHGDSAGEQIQRWAPNAHVVKAFNIVNYAHMVTPRIPGGPPDMFICGNDDAAKKTVTAILKDFGWPAVDIGGIEGARLIEPLAMLIITCAIRQGSWDIAFKLLR